MAAHDPPEFDVVYLFLYASLLIALPFTFPAVARKCSMSDRGAAALCEYAVTFSAILSRISDMSVQRMTVRIREPDHSVLSFSRLEAQSGPFIWYLCLAPPRLITITPGVLAVAAAFAAFTAPKHVSGEADWCLVLLVPFELVVTVGLIRIWERDRRRNFEARTALFVQNQRGRALVSALRRNLIVPSPTNDSPAARSRRSSVYQPLSSPPQLNAVYADAAVVAVRIIAPDETQLLELKKLLAIAAERVASVMEHNHHQFTPFASAHDVMCYHCVAALSTDDESPSQGASEAACLFARALHRMAVNLMPDSSGLTLQSAAASEVKLRVGVSAGPLHLTGDASGTIVTGRSVKAALRLCDLALPGSTLIGGEVRGLAAGTFTTTLLHETVLDGRRAALHLLGMPWSDAGLLWEATLQRRLRVVDGASTDDLPELPTSSASVGGAFEDLADEAQAESTVEFRWSWLFGWYFVDAEVEDEFRSQECRGPARLFPAAVTVGVCFVVMGWYLSSGLEALKPLCWVTWGAATVLAFATIPVAWPLRLGQRRMLVLQLLLHLCVMLLSISLHFLDDYHNPMKLYMIAVWSFSFIAGVVWIPSALPVLVIEVAELSCCVVAAPDTLFANKHYYFVTVTSIVLTVLIMQTVRCRNRWLFADSLAAHRSRETWLAARDQLERAFQRIVPAEVARRVVAAGTRSLVEAKEGRVHDGSQNDSGSNNSNASQWLRFDIYLGAATVLALETDRADGEFDDDDCEEATCIVNAQLTACCTARDGMLWCMAGTTWLLVALRDEDNSATKFLTDAAKDIEDAMRSIGYAVVTGIGRGRLSGDLVGHRSRRYEVCGDAVTTGLASMADGTAHLERYAS
jgi:hypothetical protein